MTGWSLAVDFGTTFTMAAVVSDDGRASVLELDGASKIPSVIGLDEDDLIVVGMASGDEAGWDPDRMERNPKRVLGRNRHVVLGGTPVSVVDAVGALLRAIADEGIRRHNGPPPERLVLTHPVRWSSSRCAELARAATSVGLPEPLLVPEPVAAAAHYLDERITEGSLVAVYDLGGGTFDAAVLRRTAAGFDVVGEPGGNGDLGGERLDDLLYGLVGGRLAQEHPELWERMNDGESLAGRRQSAELRRDVRRAKEVLSRQHHYVLHLAAVGADVRITRPEFDALVQAPLRDTVDELATTIERAGVAPADLAAIYLVGGASRIPMVSRLIAERFGDLPATYDDPKSVVVLGAAALTRPARSTDDEVGGDRRGDGPYAALDPTRLLGERAPDSEPVTPPRSRGRRTRWALAGVAAGVLLAAVLGTAAVVVAPRLVSHDAPLPAPAAVAHTVPPAAPVVLVTPTTTPTPTTTVAPTTHETTTTTHKPTHATTSSPSSETTKNCTGDCLCTNDCTGAGTGTVGVAPTIENPAYQPGSAYSNDSGN